VADETAAPRRLDARGLNCPLPALKTRKALRGLPAGGLLLVEATDPLAGIDIPHLCREDGHRLVSTTREGAVQSFLIEKAAS
jgi:tRNA 2-thiouridine synthesizing protein A